MPTWRALTWRSERSEERKTNSAWTQPSECVPYRKVWCLHWYGFKLQERDFITGFLFSLPLSISSFPKPIVTIYVKRSEMSRKAWKDISQRLFLAELCALIRFRIKLFQEYFIKCFDLKHLSFVVICKLY